MPLRWDRETLYDVHFVAHPPDRTLFAGIYQVPPGELPADRRRARSRHPVLGLGLSRHGRDTRPSGDPREWVEPARALVRGGGPAAPARRRAGRLLPERRHRLVRGARLRVAALRPAAARLHALVRSRRLRRRRARPRAGGALRRRVLPHRRSLGAPGRSLRRRDLSRRAAVRERARRREVPAEPRRARCRHQGRADRRGQRRDLRRLSALPARSGAATATTATTPAEKRGCSPSSRRPTACRPAR